MYGIPTIVLDPKVAEILEDEDSLQYAQYIKTQKRDKSSNAATFYPGRIKDWINL